MPLSTLQSLTFVGVRAMPVQIEVHLSAGLPSFALVGLPDAEIRESKERVRSALLNSGFEFPSQRITVNLAPADLPKGTASFDLAIALGIAAASGQLPKANLDDWIFAGELSLSGQLATVRSPFALGAAVRRESILRKKPYKLMMPAAMAPLAANVPNIEIYGPNTLFEAAAHLVGHGPQLEPVAAQRMIQVIANSEPRTDSDQNTNPKPDTQPDMADVIGHQTAKHALLAAASGQHHIRLVGPPGSGKSMLAQRLGGLMPNLPFDDALEISMILSLKGESDLLVTKRPFRNPHPSSSMAALIGGGNPPTPGEITLAHQGVLFTDEVLEFDRRCLESLREPLETGRVNIARAGHQASFPARFLWICAHNPCPCGWLGHPAKECRCTPEQVRRYQSRLSGPLADRLDISIEVNPIEHSELLAGPLSASKPLNTEQKPNIPTGQGGPFGRTFNPMLHNNTDPSIAVQQTLQASATDNPDWQHWSTAQMREKVSAVRELQMERQGNLNGELPPGLINQFCKPKPDAEKLLLNYAQKHHLSARALHRICRVARTLADLDDSPSIEKKHVATAIQYRRSLNQNPAVLLNNAA